MDIRRHERVYEKSRTSFALDSDGDRVLLIGAIASLIISVIALLLVGVGLLGRGY